MAKKPIVLQSVIECPYSSAHHPQNGPQFVTQTVTIAIPARRWRSWSGKKKLAKLKMKADNEKNLTPLFTNENIPFILYIIFIVFYPEAFLSIEQIDAVHISYFAFYRVQTKNLPCFLCAIKRLLTPCTWVHLYNKCKIRNWYENNIFSNKHSNTVIHIQIRSSCSIHAVHKCYWILNFSDRIKYIYTIHINIYWFRFGQQMKFHFECDEILCSNSSAIDHFQQWTSALLLHVRCRQILKISFIYFLLHETIIISLPTMP